MLDRAPDRAAAKWWQKFLGGLTAAMLLPVPAFAFTWVNNWVATGVSNAGWGFSDASSGPGDSFLNIFPTTLNTTSPNVSATITLTRTINFSANQNISVNDTNSGTLGANSSFAVSAVDTTDSPNVTLAQYNKTGAGALGSNGPNMFSVTLPPSQYVIQVTFQLNSPATGSGWNVSSPTSVIEFKGF